MLCWEHDEVRDKKHLLVPVKNPDFIEVIELVQSVGYKSRVLKNDFFSEQIFNLTMQAVFGPVYFEWFEWMYDGGKDYLKKN